jgi:hypothetical protein
MSHSAIVNTDSGRIEAGVSFKTLEMKRAVIRIRQPKPITFVSYPLRSLRQQRIMLPELRRRFRLQVREVGQSRRVSLRRAVRACSTRKSSFPAAASLAICRSHSSSTSSNQASNSSRSTRESAPAACLISSIVLTEIKISYQVEHRKTDFLLRLNLCTS